MVAPTGSSTVQLCPSQTTAVQVVMVLLGLVGLANGSEDLTVMLAVSPTMPSHKDVIVTFAALFALHRTVPEESVIFFTSPSGITIFFTDEKSITSAPPFSSP
jgi:hypothetical protein